MNLTIQIIPISYYVYLSQNKYRKYITARGREYKQQIEDKLSDFMVDKKIKTEDIKVSLVFYHNNRRKNDIDNYAKPILDFMSDIVYKDDRQIIELNIKKFYDKYNPRIVIHVEDASNNSDNVVQ
jgi:crossover junction endodeoxyribonuclease RusA